jgi:tRNA-splicing ligase RtcB
MIGMIKFENMFNVRSHTKVDKEKLKVPIKLWLSEVEEGALLQMENLANLPFVFHHVAGMPDMHQGFGMPIGGVMATQGYVVPNAVGMDIGCGMCALRTNIYVGGLSKAVLKNIMGDIRKLIPVGFKHNKNSQHDRMPSLQSQVFSVQEDLILDKEWDSATKQIGTLGGGNHFIEIQKGNDGFIWIMIHSGSRNLGAKIATHYNKVAVELNEKWKTVVPKNWKLAFLPLDHIEAKKYLYEMEYCCNFALANRKLMMDRVLEALNNNINNLNCEIYNNDFINIHHNYASMENHFGQNVLVHRKGATRAYEGELGIIPGSQGTKSYIVKGKGNPESFKSCSHGSGRLMSRSKAKEKLNLKDEIEKLNKLGVVHGIRNISDLDEASGAYKDINDVMLHQADLVDIEVELEPMGVVKG